jgi:cell division protease FtsH
MSQKDTKKRPAKSSSKKKPALIPRKFVFKLNLNKFFSKGLLYLLIGLLFLPFLTSLFATEELESISISQMVSDVRDEKVEKVEVSGDEFKLNYKDEVIKTVRKEPGQGVVAIFEAADIDLAQTDIEIIDISGVELFKKFLIELLPTLIVFGLIGFFFYRQMKGAQNGIMGIGRSKAKIYVKGKQNTNFKDVGGMDEAKQELEEVVDFLKHPKKYTKVGARTPKGVLLVGPAGTGKTLLARAVAGEANVQFLSIAGSEFMEMLVGVGASRVRDLFGTAKKLAPSIIFIDEIDAIGRTRSPGHMGGHDEREQTLNQILVEMDGFSQNDNVIVMAATNRGDMLDSALVRPGRFDRRVMVSLPDLEERKFIISIHAKGKPFVKSLDWTKVAKRTVGFSGADIENMLNEAAIGVARVGRDKITLEDINEASLKVKLGPSKKRLQDPLERKMTAYHEAGHALVSHLLPNSDPVSRISIVSRGHALGYTFTPPERDKLQVTKSELLDEMAVLLAGRAAEELIFDEKTAGASNDIERATKVARAMVVSYGMSGLGAMNFTPQTDMTDLRMAWSEPAKISEHVQQQVDQEIQNFIAVAHKKAKALITKHRFKLDKVSEKLLEVETLDGDEFTKLMGIKKSK